jgi:hypothetical protein
MNERSIGTAPARERPNRERRASRADWHGLTAHSGKVVTATLAAAMLVTGVALFHLTRGTTFYFDEWNFILYRRGDSVHTFLAPYKGHFSLVPIVVYRVMLAVFGLNYVPFRVMVIVAQLIVAGVVYVYARRRVPDLLALGAALLVLLFGAGSQDFIWAFQIAWLIAVAAGCGALVALDRPSPRRDALACGLLCLAVLSTEVGTIIALGVAVQLIASRRWRAAWIAATPIVLYILWWIIYQTSQRTARVSQIPKFVANSASAAVAGVLGRPGTLAANGGELLTVGRPLLAVTAVIVLIRFWRLRRIPPRALGLLTILVVFWVATGYTRAWLGGGDQAWASRYIYVGGLFLVLLWVELAAGATIAFPVQLLVLAAVVFAVIANVQNNLRPAAQALRESGAATRADLGALAVGRDLVGPGYTLAYIPGFPFVVVHVGAYLAATRQYGDLADSVTQIERASPDAQDVADLELIRIHGVVLRSTSVTPAAGAPLSVTGVIDGTITRGAGCASYRAGARISGSAGLDMVVPPAGLAVTAEQGTVSVGVRRFAPGFIQIGAVPAGQTKLLHISPDRVARPWSATVVSHGRVSVCALP